MNEILCVRRIDNSRVVKPLDLTRSHESHRAIMLAALTVTVVLLYCWHHVSFRDIGYQIEELSKEKHQLQEEMHKLEMERASLKNPQRIDLIARGELGLNWPQQDQVWLADHSGSGPDASAFASNRRHSPEAEPAVRSHVID